MSRLVIASWNVLADAYIRKEWFPLSHAGQLAPGARTGPVCRFAKDLDVDVLALQEVEEPLVSALVEELEAYDVRWCPKGKGRPDGCATAVRRPWSISGDDRLLYDDAHPRTGHVAHVVRLLGPDREEVVVTNTHLRWAPFGMEQARHVGVRQVRQLIDLLADEPVAVVAADTNDGPGGPVREALISAGYLGADADGPTSLVAGAVTRSLDIVAVRGASVTGGPAIEVVPPLPGPRCPSDHVPIRAVITIVAARRRDP